MASTDMDKDLRTDRPLTEKGQSMYESSVDKYLNRLNEQWKNIELIISTIDNSARYSVLCQFEDELEQGHAKLTLIKDDFVRYLNRTKTTESQECLAKLTTTFDEKTNTLEEAFQQISHLKGEIGNRLSVFAQTLVNWITHGHCRSRPTSKSPSSKDQAKVRGRREPRVKEDDSARGAGEKRES